MDRDLFRPRLYCVTETDRMSESKARSQELELGSKEGRDIYKRCPIIFIESFTRVEELSLSGKLVYSIADRFIVPWEKLKIKYPRAEYIGQIL
ncbi:UDP-N-acetylglucosamine transferase subunit [Irineochytrium annulatum]|nr:UDP-N-acetylglucosamine transferase subunit [Irineochytrium annulatum]